MRPRTLLLAAAIAVLVLFALLNWDELSRTTTLNLGWRTATAPLGWLLLGIAGLAVLGWMISSASNHTRMLLESRKFTKDLEAQRALADKAEASRFTDLRQQLDTHLRETRQREVSAAAEFDKAMANHQRELRNQLEQMHRSLAARIGELEARIDARAGRAEAPLAPPLNYPGAHERPATVTAPAEGWHRHETVLPHDVPRR